MPEPTQIPAPLPPMPTLKDRIATSIKMHEDQLKHLKELSDALNENPDLEKSLTAFQRAGIY
jgi:hypothetical protein